MSSSSSSRWEIKSETSKNASHGQSNEKITLCVKNKSSTPIKQEAKETAKKAKNSKKSKSSGKSSSSKSSAKRQCKEEYASTGEDNADMETTDAEDSSVANQVDEAAVQQARQELINSALLKEILNEKKRALFESEEMLQFFKERNESFCKTGSY